MFVRFFGVPLGPSRDGICPFCEALIVWPFSPSPSDPVHRVVRMQAVTELTNLWVGRAHSAQIKRSWREGMEGGRRVGSLALPPLTRLC